MTSLCTAGILFHSFHTQAQAPVKQWDKAFGGTGTEYSYSLQPSNDGGYIIGGYSDSGITGSRTQASRGDFDYWVVKMDANGTKLWDKAYGGTKGELMRAMLPTSDGGFLLGGYSYSDIGGEKTEANRGGGDYWVVKIDANGNKLWDKTFGGVGEDQLFALQASTDGGYLLGGISQSGISGDKTQGQGAGYWLVRIDANGNKLWDKAFGNNGINIAQVLYATDDGGWLVAGESTMTFNDPDRTAPLLGGSDIWLLKLDADGNKVWDKSYGGNSTDRPRALQPTKDGNFLLAGYSTSGISGTKTQASKGGPDYWILKIDPVGTILWDKTFGGDNLDYLYALQPTADGNYLLGGLSSSTSSGDKTQGNQGGYDYWVLKMDPNGNKLWDITVGGSADDYQFGLQPTSDAGFIVSGHSSSEISGDKTQAMHGVSDYWLVKMAPAVTTPTRVAARQLIQIYPNPASSHLTLHLPATLPRVGLRVLLLDATGRTVFRQPLLMGSSTAAEVEVGKHAPGLYMLRLEGPTSILSTQRVFLQ